MKWFTLAFLVLLFILPGCPQPPSAIPDEIRGRGELVIGTEPEFYPFEYRTEDGGYAGLDIDMARLLAADLGVKLRIENLGFTALIPALQSGKIDIIFSGMTATEERARSIAFSDSYFQTGLCLLLNKETAKGVKSWEDLNDKKWTIAVKETTTGEKVVRKLMPNAKRVALEKETDCAMEVATGRAHAFVYDKLSIIKNHKAHPDTTRVILETFTTEPYALGLRQEDTALLAYVNDFLKRIRADGRMKALEDENFKEYGDEAR
jgi:polar amino acid transport system substrate-binding protein